MLVHESTYCQCNSSKNITAPYVRETWLKHEAFSRATWVKAKVKIQTVSTISFLITLHSLWKTKKIMDRNSEPVLPWRSQFCEMINNLKDVYDHNDSRLDWYALLISCSLFSRWNPNVQNCSLRLLLLVTLYSTKVYIVVNECCNYGLLKWLVVQ